MLEVNDVIISALKILGRGELAELLSGGQTLDDEGQEAVNTLIYCFNAVEDEVARKYITLTAKDEIFSITGKFDYSKFSHTPVKIKRVCIGGKDTEYELFPQYIAVNGMQITVEYEYSPSKKKLGDKSDFGEEVSEYLLALGTAAEYCLINGEIEASEIWEKKYRQQIDLMHSKLPCGGNIPPRRWV